MESDIEDSEEEEMECKSMDVAVQTERSDIVKVLLEENTSLSSEKTMLQMQLNETLFRFETVTNEKQFKAVVGFSRTVFNCIFFFFFLCLDECLRKVGELTPINQFFLFLVYLRTGNTQIFLSILFKIHQTVSKVLTNICHLTYAKLRSIDIWQPRDKIDGTITPIVGRHLPNCRIIIDCTEFPMQKPSSPLLQQQTFSQQRKP